MEGLSSSAEAGVGGDGQRAVRTPTTAVITLRTARTSGLVVALGSTWVEVTAAVMGSSSSEPRVTTATVITRMVPLRLNAVRRPVWNRSPATDALASLDGDDWGE